MTLEEVSSPRRGVRRDVAFPARARSNTLLGGLQFAGEIVAAVADDRFMEGSHLVVALDGQFGQSDARFGLDAFKFINGGGASERIAVSRSRIDPASMTLAFERSLIARVSWSASASIRRTGAERGNRPVGSAFLLRRASATVTWVRRSDALPMMLPKAPAPAAFLSSARVFSRSRTFCHSLAIRQSRPSR